MKQQVFTTFEKKETESSNERAYPSISDWICQSEFSWLDRVLHQALSRRDDHECYSFYEIAPTEKSATTH